MEKREKIKRTKTHDKRYCYLFFLLLTVGTCVLIYRYYREEKNEEERFAQLEEIEEEREDISVPQKVPKEVENPDWIGWVKIENTSFSYPVMQRKAEGEFYLHRDFDGNYSFYGTPFLDGRCTWDSDNSIIYGHNINGGRMFGKLHAYVWKSYYKEHPTISVRAGEERRTYKIVSVMKTDISSSVYSFTDVGNWEEYRDYVKTVVSSSVYPTKMGKEIEEKIKEESVETFFKQYQFVTLSTCRSYVGKDARLLVIGARERGGG